MLIGSTPADERCTIEAAERAVANIVATLNAADACSDHQPRCRDMPTLRTYRSAVPHAALGGRCCIRRTSRSARARSELRVTGVILWTVTEDAGLAWATPRIERAFADHATLRC